MSEIILSTLSLGSVIFAIITIIYKIFTQNESLTLTLSGAGLVLTFIQVVNLWWDTILKFI